MLRTPTMTRLGRQIGACVPWLGVGLLAGCSLVSDLGRFEPAAGGTGGGATDSGTDAGATDAGDARAKLGCANPQTLCVRLEGWPHKDRLAVVDLVTDADNNLRTRAMLEPFGVGGASAEIVLPLAIPPSDVPKAGEDHPLHLEIWADLNDDGEYTPHPIDHDWERDVPATGTFVFPHDGVFNDLLPRPRGIGGDFRMRFRDMQLHAGRMFEVMVIEESTGRSVGFSRVQKIPADGDFEVLIPEIVDPGGVTYRIEFLADVNDNRTYDDPPKDHAWVVFAESNDNGIETEFAHGDKPFDDLDYQFDFDE